jgi:hypothetical protein
MRACYGEPAAETFDSSLRDALYSQVFAAMHAGRYCVIYPPCEACHEASFVALRAVGDFGEPDHRNL